MADKQPKLIVQIPVYNEEKKIARVIRAVPREIKGVGKVEVLVQDDHSIDNTAKVAKDAGADYVVTNYENKGLGRNFKAGIENCLRLGADIIVNIDGDGQFDAADIPALIRPVLEHKADMVTCSRFLNQALVENMPFIRKFGNGVFTWLVSRVTEKRFTDTQCGFRAYSKEAAMRMNLFGKFTYTQEVFMDLVERGMRIEELPLKVKYYRERKSHISGSLFRYGFNCLAIIAKTLRDTSPLSFFGKPGLAMFALGLVGGAFSLFYWLTHLATTPVRFVFGVSVFLMTFGLLLGIFALIADMLKRMSRNQGEILYRLKVGEYGR